MVTLDKINVDPYVDPLYAPPLGQVEDKKSLWLPVIAGSIGALLLWNLYKSKEAV